MSEERLSYVKAMATFEREYIRTLMVRHNNCVKAAAKEAQLNRTHFYDVLARNGITPPRVLRTQRWRDLSHEPRTGHESAT